MNWTAYFFRPNFFCNHIFGFKLLLHIPLWQIHGMSVLYFNQHLGATDSKRWSKYTFSMCFCFKAEKRRKFVVKFGQKCFFDFALEPWSSVFLGKNLWPVLFCKLKNTIFFAKMCVNFHAFSFFFRFLGWKTPNAGQNIQHISIQKCC